MQNMMSGGMSGGYGIDPDQLDLMQLQKKKELAQQMVMGAKPAATRAGGILGVITALLAGRQMSQADEGIKSAMDRQNQRRMGDMDNFANLLTMRPQGPQAQTNPVANDDEGNPMPAAPMTLGEAPDAFQARKMELAKSMISSSNPQVAQFAMQSLMPQKKDFMTVKEGDTILDPTQIGPDGKPKLIWGGQHKAPEGFRYNAAGMLEVIPGYAQGKGEIAKATKPADLDAMVIMGPNGPMINPLAVEAKKQIAAAGRAPGAPRLQYDPERGGVIDLNTGEFRPVSANGQPIGARPAKPEKLTEFEGKSTTYGMRAAESAKILDSLGTDGVKGAAFKRGMDNLPLIGGVAGMAANAVASDPAQLREQAERNFVNATLRQESGAAISPGEFDNAIKQYFDRPGDSEAVRAQKKQNRETAIKGFTISAGPGAKNIPKVGNGQWSITKVND